MAKVKVFEIWDGETSYLFDDPLFFADYFRQLAEANGARDLVVRTLDMKKKDFLKHPEAELHE